jgi:hypothetical protein
VALLAQPSAGNSILSYLTKRKMTHTGPCFCIHPPCQCKATLIFDKLSKDSHTWIYQWIAMLKLYEVCDHEKVLINLQDLKWLITLEKSFCYPRFFVIPENSYQRIFSLQQMETIKENCNWSNSENKRQWCPQSQWLHLQHKSCTWGSVIIMEKGAEKPL